MTRETPTRDTLPTSFFLFILSCRSTHVLHEPCSWRRLEGTIYTICIACVLGPLEDGSKQDTVMLRGTAVNQDGRSSALTAPHGPSQQQVMRMSLHSADLDAWSAQVLQMHGTGTPLGGPIEVGAASAVLLSEATKRTSLSTCLEWRAIWGIVKQQLVWLVWFSSQAICCGLCPPPTAGSLPVSFVQRSFQFEFLERTIPPLASKGSSY
ncbi:polyketide synthase [Chloropicon primus]|uniref:Polyketide synthase n=1 Tax=Chloropicon primus TaxID=1764295 RepID=A0A5B8N072_9CHLO|nr:polyketide synthase [Chloropicon primus]|eukprot:QDZ25134.1 polyketide synthase [Chloropicon primus]